MSWTAAPRPSLVRGKPAALEADLPSSDVNIAALAWGKLGGGSQDTQWNRLSTKYDSLLRASEPGDFDANTTLVEELNLEQRRVQPG